MKLNNKGFILYESLVTLIILSSFIFFFLLSINIIQNRRYYQNIQYDALSYFRESIYYNEKQKEYINYKKENIKSVQSDQNYCIQYKGYNKYEKICTK